MKKVPNVGVRKRGRPPKKQRAIDVSAPLATGEGTQLAVTDTLESDVHVTQTRADISSSEKRTINSDLKTRHGGKSAASDSAKMTGRKRCQNSSDGASSDGKRSSDKMKTLLSKTVKQKSRKVSQRVTPLTARILSRRKSKPGLQISQKKKSKLRKFCSRKISRMKSAKTQVNELKDSIASEMRRLLTTDGFWSTKVSSRSSSPHSQSNDSHLQKQTTASKKGSRTSTPDIIPSGTRRHSLAKTCLDKDDTTLQRSNIPGAELRRLRTTEGRLRTTEGISFPDAAVASRTSSRDVSPCSSSSLDRGTRQNSRSVSRANEKKNGMKIDDAEQVVIADDVTSARPKMTGKKEACSGKDKLSEDQRNISDTVSPLTADAPKLITCESPVSRFRKKHNLDKAANITKQKRFSANIQSKKISLTQGTSRRPRLKSKSVTSQSIAGESSIDPQLSTSINLPDVKKDRRFSRHGGDTGITENTSERRKGKQKQRNISDIGTLVPHVGLEDGLENSHVPVASNISLVNNVSSAKSHISPELISDLLDSVELKRLNTTAGFWSSASGIETVINIDQPRKLRDADGNSIKEANGCIKAQPARIRNAHLGKFPQTAVTPTSTLLQHRKKRLRSLQSQLMKTRQCVSSTDLAEQQQSLIVGRSPASGETGSERKSRPKARLFGVRRHRRKQVITLDTDNKARNIQEIQTASGSFSVVDSEAIAKESTQSAVLLIDASGSKYEKAKCVQTECADLKSLEIDTKEPIMSVDLLIAKHDDDTSENCQGIQVSKEPVDSEMDSKISHETPDLKIDTSVIDTFTAQKPLLKTSKRGRRKLRCGEIDTNMPVVSVDKHDGDTTEKCQRIQTFKDPVDSEMDFKTPHETPDLKIDTSFMDTLTAQKPLPKTSKRGRGKLRSGEKDTKKPLVSVDKHDGDTPDNCQGIQTSKDPVDSEMDSKTSKDPVDSEMDSKTSHETPDLKMDALVTDASTVLKPLLKTGKRGRRKLRPGEGRVTPSSSIRTRGRGQVENALDNSLEVLQNLEPSNEDAQLASSPVTSKVAGERWKTKKVRKDSLVKVDLSEHISGAEIDKHSSHAEIDKQSSHQAEIGTHSSHHTEIAQNNKIQIKDNENDNQSDTETPTVEIDNEKHARVGKQNSMHTQSNLFESLGYSLHMPSEASPTSCVNILAHDVKYPCSLNDNVAESQFSAPNLPTTENICDKKLNTLCVSPGEPCAINVSDSTENILNPQLKDAEYGVTDVGKEVVDDVLEELGAGCPDVSHSDLSLDTSGRLQNLQSAILSENVVSSEPFIQGSIKSDALNITSVWESQNCALHIEVPVPEVKGDALKGDDLTSESGVMESSSCVEEIESKDITTAGPNQPKFDVSGKEIDENSEVDGGKEQISRLEESKSEHDGKIKFAEPNVRTDAASPHEECTAIIPTSADLGLFEKFQDSLTQRHLFAEAQGGKSNDVSMESVDFENKERCEMLKRDADDAADDTAENIPVNSKPVIEADKDVDSAASDSAGEFGGSEPDLAHTSCENRSTKSRKRKMEQTSSVFRCKIRKDMTVTGDTSIAASPLMAADLSSCEESATADTSVSLDVPVVPLVTADDLSSCGKAADTSLSLVVSSAVPLLVTDDLNSCEEAADMSVSLDVPAIPLVTVDDLNICEEGAHMSVSLDVPAVPLVTADDFNICEEAAAADTSVSLVVPALPLEASDDLNSCEEAAETTQNDGPQEATVLQTPVKKTRKRKRNAWQRGVLRKAARISRKVPKSESAMKSVPPEQSDISTSVLISNDDKVCMSDDVEKMDELTSALISDATHENQIPDCLQENNTLLPAVNSNCSDGNQISRSPKTSDESTSAALISDSSTKIPDLDDSKPQVSGDSQKNDIPMSFVMSNGDTTTGVSDNLKDENKHLVMGVYTPAVTKSLKNMLKKLQTDANLAHADFEVQSYKGKFLRNVKPKEQKQKRLRFREKLLHADQKIEGESEGMVASSVTVVDTPQMGISEFPVKKKRGRPKKQAGETLPKLNPVRALPLLRYITPWNTLPPDLSPQDLTLPQFVDVDESKKIQDVDIVSENVDDTDLHLYLSGVSDEEQSPRKGPGPASDVSFHADISVYPEKINSSISVYEEKIDSGTSVYEEKIDSSTSLYEEKKDSSTLVYQEKKNSSNSQETHTDHSFGGEESFITQKSVLFSGKEPKRRGRPKKGSRGRPPGIPMTDEERLKRKDEEKLKRRKALKAFKEECEDQNLLRFLRTSQRSVDTSDLFAAPTFSGTASTPAGNFSLRKKSTRSPLEMLAMKRKQEEAIYDMEQERRQARLIHLREKRSARESGEGFSDDEVGEDNSENLMTCSVVLNDFVKKLQLDELDLSSGEEVSHESPDNLWHGVGSPDYNPFEDRDEDWCADFEEHDSEEWNNNRPSIPRLKLKRIIKKGTQSQVKSTKLAEQPPKQPQHVPIKLLIKTEPVAELNEQAGARASSGIDSSKAERSGFENSYMDFLKKKSQSVPGKSGAPKRSHNVSRPAQLEEGTQNGVTDLSAVEILSLPTYGVRGAFAVDAHSFITGVQSASVIKHLPASSSVSDRASALVSTKVGANAYSSDKLPSLEHAGTTRHVVSVDDEDDDILILDLDDGAVEQNSNDLPLYSGSASSAVHHAPDITHSIPDVNHENIPVNHSRSCQELLAKENSCVNAFLSHLQRSYSNDEMGLMLESYNSQKDPDKLNQLSMAQNAVDSFLSVENLENLSGNREASHLGDISQPLACVFKDTGVKAIEMQHILVSVPESEKSPHEVQKVCTVGLSIDAPTVSTEASRNGTTVIDDSDSAVVSDDITNTEALQNKGHKDGDTVTCCRQHDGDSVPKVNRPADSVIVDKVIETSINDAVKEVDNNLDPEILATTSNKAVEYVPGDASSDNNNVTSARKSSLKTGSFKKPGLAGDNNKSPKHSTYHGSVPEDWRVKVILQSDKFPSGKYSCKRCSFTAPAKLAIESHIYSHIPGVQFRCAYCESEFSSMAATSSHLKNTHSLSEAKLFISRHIDEKNFYDKEAAVFSEESGHQSPIHPASTGTNAGGQSPPVIISVVVSSRGGRSSTPAHRFVCTHCGFSTNVKEDAEHHVLDLHSSQALFACLLCSENVCYTESEIKDHCAIVHPARKHPYKKLPDFYDAELLSLKEKTPSQDDRENIFERMSSLFQDETQTGISTIDHKQKAKEYLYLQEGWREKTKVEADSTTAVDYTDEHDSTEEQSAPLTPVQEDSLAESIHQTSIGENEVFDDHRSNSQAPGDSEGVADLCETAALINDDFITSSAGTVTNASKDSHMDSDACSELHNQQIEQEEAFSQLTELPSRVAGETTDDEHSKLGCLINPDHGMEDNDDDGDGMGLKIVQVVSLSEQSEDMDDQQMATEHVHAGTDSAAGSGEICQTGAVSSENSLTCNNALEFLATEPLSAPHDTITQTESSVLSSVEKETATSGPVITTELSATDSPATDNSSAPSPIASPSFAGGLPLSYKCNACKVHTPYLLMMVKHLKAKHPNMRCFSCPYCKTAQSFVSQKQLRHHVKQAHPTKFGRNEIALSEDARKFVEAMVLPIGPECIRVGNRIVLEEDIHTCTYCQVKMVSLTSVYEHLNTKHSDLFEFVCPVCQNFRSKLLPEIFEHCLKTHKSALDTDKVHVSVPKNLFTALTCISKSGKYIEKTLAPSSPEKTPAGSTSSTSQQPEKAQVASFSQQIAQPLKEGSISSSKQHPLSEKPSATTPLIPIVESLPTAQVIQPIFAVPLTSTSVGVVPLVSAARPVIAFSSSLFDTSSLTTPQLPVASHSIPLIQNAAASSFLSPLPQQAHGNSQQTHGNSQQAHSNSQQAHGNSQQAHGNSQQSSKELHLKSSERTHGSAKHLPVLNVPTIRPRTSPVVVKPVVGNPVGVNPLAGSNCNLSVMSTSGAGHKQFRSTSSSSIIDNLPDDEPNPDAFKIFNLCPTGPRISSSSSLTPGVPTVFPPVSAPMAAGYIQGPIAGFPPGMVISPNLFAFPYSQHQSVMQGLLAQKQSQQSSSLSRHPHLSHTSSALMAAAQSASAMRNSMSSEEVAAAATAYLKKQQQRELYLKKQQHQQQQLESHRHQLFRHSQQQQAVPRAYPAHQQPPSLSGQVYQSLPYDHQQTLTGSSDPLHGSLFSSSVPVSSSSSSSGPSSQLMAHSSPSPGRPSKGLHKRSNSLYQCPYCPVVVTLKALEVASHIQQHHPGKQVTFRKIV